MKRYFQTILLVAIILLSTTLAEDVYALSASGSGNITFDGTGTIIHMQSPFTIIEVFNTNCTPSTVGDIITRCNAPVDTSLLGSGITRAEDVRVSAPFAGPFHVSFGCEGCSDGISVSNLPQGGLTGGRLTDENIVALQSLIDQHGPAAIHMSLSLTSGSVIVESARALVQVDVKPGNDDNIINPKGRGLLPVAILTQGSFDASSVDIDSVQFGISGHEISPTRAVLDDVDGDGDLDLVLFFRLPATGLQCGTLFTYLRGQTTDSSLFAGYDSITTVGCE